MEAGKSIQEQEQTRLKRHILGKHKTHPRVAAIINLPNSEIVNGIAVFRREAILRHNQESVKIGNTKNILREYKKRKLQDEEKCDVLPVLCTGCRGFFSKTYKVRHQNICTANAGAVMMVPLVTGELPTFDGLSDGFKSLLNTMKIDEVSDTVKADCIILMIGNRYYSSLKRKRDKQIETTKYVRARLRLTARVYMAFKHVYDNQNHIFLESPLNNAADMFRREVITLLSK